MSKKKKKKELNLITDKDLLKRFYGEDKNLDNSEKFLRNYILMEGWKEKDKNKIRMMNEEIDREDEQRDNEMDEFEEKYNFRFE